LKVFQIYLNVNTRSHSSFSTKQSYYIRDDLE
jgi:hypothetical protein